MGNDLAINVAGICESIFIEAYSDHSIAVVGEINRVPNTMYEGVISRLHNVKNYIIISTDLNFDYIKIIDQNKNTQHLFDTFCRYSNK